MKFAVAAFTVALLFSGCGVKKQTVAIGDRDLLSEIQCIGILPFENTAENSQAGKIFETLVENELLTSRQFTTLGSDDVRSLINAARLQTATENASAIGKIGQDLRVQALLTGTVYEYKYREVVDADALEPYVGFKLSLFHIPTGELVWTNSLNRSSRDVSGKNRDPLSRVAMLASKESVDMLRKSIRRNVDSLTLAGCGPTK